MWDIRRFARMEHFPPGKRVVIHFHLTDAPRGERQWWLVVEDRIADLCRDDPGHEVSVVVESTVRGLTECRCVTIDDGNRGEGPTLEIFNYRATARPLCRFIPCHLHSVAVPCTPRIPGLML